MVTIILTPLIMVDKVMGVVVKELTKSYFLGVGVGEIHVHCTKPFQAKSMK